MGEEKFVTDQHKKARSVFRVLGPLFLIIAGVCILIALIDFFTLEGFDEPKYFWLFFAAMPFFIVGSIFLNLGFGSAVAKYQSREYAPVAKETFNYLAKETVSGVKEISKAVKGDNSLKCPNCQKEHSASAKFCDSCGERLVQICRQCEHVNAAEARFCQQCGSAL